MKFLITSRYISTNTIISFSIDARAGLIATGDINRDAVIFVGVKTN